MAAQLYRPADRVASTSALIPVAMALARRHRHAMGPASRVILLFTLQQWLLVNVTLLQATIYGLVILLIGRFMPGGLLRARVAQRVPLLRALTPRAS